MTATMITKPVAMGDWAVGCNKLWLDDKIKIAIDAYRVNHRQLVAAEPHRKIEIERQLGLALFAQIEYAVWLTEQSIIDTD